uniref:Uncharacterized protein n=1 Tax=Plectus sambesii TaxID=2011161 RepID=A0A914VB90_9BILA
SGKRRYCVFRRAPDNKLLLEVQKSPGSALTQPALLVDKVQQATKKGKPVLEVTPSESDRKSVVLVAEVDNDIANWVQELESALNSTSREDTVSTGSAGRGDTESILSDDSRASDGASWRGRNAAARALHPPIVDRRGLFALYADLDPLPEPKGSSSLLAIGESTADVIKLPAEKASVRFAVEFKSLDVKLPVTANKTEQIEPFFLRLFLFDARSGRRLSEEFRVDPNPEAIDALLAKLAGKSSTGDWLGMDQKFVTAKRAYKAIFSVAQPHRDVYLVVRVDRVLSLDASVDAYMKADVRATAKLQKNVGAACLKLGQYRTPFAWGARLVFQEFLGVGAQVPDAMQLYKCDPSKMADSDLQKVLSDFTKAEKAGKLTPITGCSVTLDVDLSAKVNELKYRLSSSLLPLRPWSTPTSADEPVLEMQSFADFREPHSSLFNLLYVYPLSLRYEGQKLFAKARNIVCTVQLVENAGGTPSKAVWDRTDAGGPLVTSSRCAVQHHEQNPTFTEETKLALPVALQPDAHLLFSFAHVSVASAVNAKTAADQAETPVGYAWLPLIKNDKLVLENDEQEFVLSIAADLPAGYVQYQALGLGKGHAGPEIRWVDNGRPLFKVRLRLVSSAFTTEGRLQSFFQSCQKLTRAGTLGDAAEQTKALLSVDIDRMTPFLPVVLGRLLSLLPVSSTEEMGLCSLRTLVGIVDKTAESKRAPLLRSFVRLQFRAPNAELAGKSETIHSALCRYVPLLLRPAHADSDTTSGLLRQLWFFLDVTVKSMGQRLLDDGKHKVARTDRFPSELLFRIESMVQTLVPLIIAKHRELPQECRSANAAVAFFLRSCLSLTDRGAVFQWIHFCVDKLDQTESRTVRDYKLELLQILAGHEHWLPLCLPVLCNLAGTVVRKASITSAHDVNAVSASKGSNNSGGFLSRFFAQIFGPATDQDGPSEAERYADCLQDLSLTEEYCSRHFPSGLLVQETLAALRDPRDFRRRAIALLRNVLAKHASDRRYQHPEAQARIATLYAPVLRLVLENLGELEAAAMGGDVPDLSPVGAATAGSIHSSKRSSSLEANSLIRESHSPSPGPPPPPPTAVTVGFAEKLDKGEARDMLLCALFILSRAPKQVLGALWLNDQADELLKLLELALHVFRYRGRKWTMKKTSNKLRATRRTLVLPSSNSATDCLTLDDDDDALPYSVLQESNLTQEVALVILEVAQALKDQVSTRLAGKAEDWDDPWMRLLHLQLSLLADHWPEAVRLHALAALAVFVNAFRARFYRGPLAALSSLIGELLLQLNSRLPAVQRAAAALLQLVLRGGYEAAVLPAAGGGGGGQQALGRPGAQTGVALARLLGQGRPLATSPFFDRGLVALEALVTVQDRRPTPFDRAVQELIGQLRGVLAATGALKESENDPIRLGDLHVRLADSYRGSAALRAAWLESLAGLQTNARWYSEAAVCHAHIVAIIGKELVAKGGMTVDWRLLSAISEAIAGEEAVTDDRADNTQQAGYSVVSDA